MKIPVGFTALCKDICFPKLGVRVKVAKVSAIPTRVVVRELDGTYHLVEFATLSEFAAMQIYAKSSDIKVSPVRFYESNEVALADIKRCAQLEAK